ncbi:hypothetical protein ACFL2Q_00160 [Thermodesulfobacteriota bacterium]
MAVVIKCTDMKISQEVAPTIERETMSDFRANFAFALALCVMY